MVDRNSHLLLAVATALLIFTSVGNGAYQDCQASLRNTVVYEGTQNILLACMADANTTAWSVRSASNASQTRVITNYNDAIASGYTPLYAINQSGLVVLKATITPGSDPISTAGVYFARFSSTQQVAAKLVVIRSGPNCYCTELGDGAVNITCDIVYSDHPVAPIIPIVNCSANGQYYSTSTPNRTLSDPSSLLYVYNSTSTITINNTVPATYDCKFTFSAPTVNPPTYLAKNAPDFSVSFTLCGMSTTMVSSTTTKLPTTTKPPTTATTPQITTTYLPTTTTKPPTTTMPPTTTVRPATTVQPTTTSQPVATTVATAQQPTTATPIPATTTAITAAPSTPLFMTTAAIQQSSGSSEVGLSSASTESILMPVTTMTPMTPVAQPSSTPPQPASTSTEIATTPSDRDIGLLTTKIVLGTILGILALVAGVVGCSLCFLYCCPPLLPFRRGPMRYLDGELQMSQRRDWIPVKREICQTDYWAVPFYQQSFSRYRSPYEYRFPQRYQTALEYRPPSRCTCVQTYATHYPRHSPPPPHECTCGHQARVVKAYCGPYAKRLP